MRFDMFRVKMQKNKTNTYFHLKMPFPWFRNSQDSRSWGKAWLAAYFIICFHLFLKPLWCLLTGEKLGNTYWAAHCGFSVDLAFEASSVSSAPFCAEIISLPTSIPHRSDIPYAKWLFSSFSPIFLMTVPSYSVYTILAVSPRQSTQGFYHEMNSDSKYFQRRVSAVPCGLSVQYDFIQ